MIEIEWVNREQILPINYLEIGQVFKYEGNSYIFIGSQPMLPHGKYALRIVEMIDETFSLEVHTFHPEKGVLMTGKARIVIE